MPSVTRTLNTSKDCPEKRFSGNGFQKLREFFIYMEIRKFVFKYCPSFISPSNLCVCVLVVVCTSIPRAHARACVHAGDLNSGPCTCTSSAFYPVSPLPSASPFNSFSFFLLSPSLPSLEENTFKRILRFLKGAWVYDHLLEFRTLS